MPLAAAASSDIWIVGYGNPQRRDDGIGPCIVNRLRPIFKHLSNVHLLALHQLEPDIVDTLKTADTILFVDASVEMLSEGRRWTAVQPELQALPCLVHQVTPSFVLWLLQCLYHRNPAAWIVSVAGIDFRFGNGLSSAARQSTEQVSREIEAFVFTYFYRSRHYHSAQPEEKSRRPT